MLPVIFGIGAAALGVYAYYEYTRKAHQVKVPVPITVGPNPPMGVREAINADVQAIIGRSNAGSNVDVVWVWGPGSQYSGDSGGGNMPLAWVSPDRTRAVIVWNIQEPFQPLAAPGELLYARVVG